VYTAATRSRAETNTLQRFWGQRATTKSPAQERANPSESTRERDDQRTT
jgi:hypothetical protein